MSKRKVKRVKISKEDIRNKILRTYQEQNDKYSKLLKERELPGFKPGGTPKVKVKVEIPVKSKNSLKRVKKSTPDIITFRSNIPKDYKQSKGEELIELILRENSIYFQKEVEIKGCVNPLTKRKLRFDFYIPEKNICIEFDGEQHFKTVREFDGNDKSLLKKRITLDKVKNNFCRVKKIKLIRIKYTQIKHIEEIIKKNII